MGSSAKTGNFFSVGHRSSFWIKLIWDRTPPKLYIKCICVGESSRVPNLQTEFNYLDSFKSDGIFSDFVVHMWSLSSLHHPCIIPVVYTSSPSSPHHPHSPQKVPMWSPWSVVSTCCPCGPRIIPVIPPSSLSSLCHPRHPHIIPVIPTLSP